MSVQKIRELKLWRKKSFILVTSVFFLLFLFLSVKIMLPCREYQYEGSRTFNAKDAGNVTVYEGICLPPGTYQIQLEYETNKDLQNICIVTDGTVFPGGLLSNGEPLYSGLKATGYDIWLYEGTGDLSVQVTYDGRSRLTTGNLKITETNGLWTMLLTEALFVWLVLLLLITYYYYNKNFPIAAKKKQAFFFVTAVGLIASIPHLQGYVIDGADLLYHLQRIEGVKDGLLGGQFPVRLEPGWVYDHGYANAIFYCNALLYFPALLRLLGFTVTSCYNLYCIVMNFATAWIAYYCFSRIFKNCNIGVVCCALYTLSIFRIYKWVDLNALGEGSAFTFLPLVFYGLYRIFTEDNRKREYRTAWVPLMLGITGLVQTHVLTCEITALVVILFCLMNIKKVFTRKTFSGLFLGAASALLLSLWFVVPFLDYYLTQDIAIKHATSRTIQDRGLRLGYLAIHFWRNGINTPDGSNGIQNSRPVGVGMILLAALGVFLILWFSGAFGRAGKSAELSDGGVGFAKKTAVVAGLLLFMSTNVFPWDWLRALSPVTASLVSSLQFPHRILGWGTVCLTFLFGYCLGYFRKRNAALYRGIVLAAFLSIVTSGMYLQEQICANQNHYVLYNEENMGVGYVSGAEYLIEGTDVDKLTYSEAVPGEGVEILAYEKGYLQAGVQCSNTESRESYVDLPLLLYKGYQGKNPDTGEEMQLCAGENNVVRVLVSAGFEGSFQVKFVYPVYWRISELVSAGAVAFMLVVWWKYRRMRHAEKEI